MCVCVFAADIAGFTNEGWLCTKSRARPTRGWTTRAETTLLPQSRHPPPNPTCPLLLNPPIPPPVPAPLLHSQLSYSHILPFLSPAVCQSLSLPSLPQSGQSCSLFSCPLNIPPPLFVSIFQLWEPSAPSSALFFFIFASQKDLRLLLCQNFWRFYFHTWLLFLVLNLSPPESLVGVCLACARPCVQGLWCRALCPKGTPLRLWLKETSSPPWMFSCCSCWPWLALSALSHVQVSELCYQSPAVSTLCPLTASASMCPHLTTLCLLSIPADWTITVWGLVSHGRLTHFSVFIH